MAYSLLEGNEAIARGAIAAGCNFFAGYPITPATTIYHSMLNLQHRPPPFITACSTCFPLLAAFAFKAKMKSPLLDFAWGHPWPG